ncbi:hypothetical protein SAMN06298226_2054 [Nitrosovibrio sp. Nv4]|nr:hypothetical protein SAMN06298226_2054 [Nitrosovibrio sp. Nv4]
MLSKGFEFSLQYDKASIVPMENSVQNSRSKYDRPSVRLLLAVLSWLTTRRHRLPDPATQAAIAYHFHLLVLHPSSDSIDIQAGIHMAGRAGMDAAGLLARYSGPARLH